MSSPWDEFSIDDRLQLLKLSKKILNNQVTVIDGAYGLWSIVLNYDFSNSKDLLFLQGVVDEFSYSERGEAHRYTPEMLERKNSDRKNSIEFYGPHIREIASKIVEVIGDA